MGFYSDAEFCDAGDCLRGHKVVDADMCAFPFSHKEGKLLGLVLVAVDAAGQGIALGIGHGIA